MTRGTKVAICAALIISLSLVVFFALRQISHVRATAVKQVTRERATELFARLIGSIEYFDGAFKRFPARYSMRSDRVPRLSWRFLLRQNIPDPNFLSEEYKAYFLKDWRDFVEAAEYPGVRNTGGSGFCLCDHLSTTAKVLELELGAVKIMGIYGPGTAFDLAEAELRLADLPPDTILIVEVANSDCHWIQPCDIDIRSVPREINPSPGIGISGNYNGGFHVGFADGEAWFLSNETPFEELAKFFTVENAQTFDREKILGQYIIDSISYLTLQENDRREYLQREEENLLKARN